MNFFSKGLCLIVQGNINSIRVILPVMIYLPRIVVSLGKRTHNNAGRPARYAVQMCKSHIDQIT